jgi:XTP/dITP diphosphohydrolase
MSPQRTASKPPILLATTNPAKLRMFHWLLEGLPLSPVTPGQLGLDSVPEEEGDTHEAIARLKAQEWSRAGSVLTIASDGGLVIPALGAHWESRFTHRFAGPTADDAERVRRLLELMRPYEGAAREASWVEALAIADRGRVLASWEVPGGAGVIAESPADDPMIPGFWAFSVCFFPQWGKSYNQLTPQELEALDNHWTRLRPMVQRFLHDHLARRLDG